MNIAIPVNGRVREKEFEKNRKTSGFEVRDYRNLECEKCSCSIVCCRGLFDVLLRNGDLKSL